MRICFFTENYYKGGLDTFTINLVNAWPNTTDELVLTCNETHPGLETISSKTDRSLQIQTYRRLFACKFAKGMSKLPMPLAVFVSLVFRIAYRLLEYPVLLPWYCISLERFFRKNNFDRLMVINGGYPASLLCRCAVIAWGKAKNKPLAIMNFHNSATAAPSYVAFVENRIDKAVLNTSSHIISVSANCLHSLNNRVAFVGTFKTDYIYNGIEDPLQGSKKAPLKGKIPYLLMLASYEERKGHTYLLTAFKDVVKSFPDVQLRIFGFGLEEEKEKVSDMVKRLSLEKNVTLNDFTTETTSLIVNASVLVVPSQSHESFGLTIIEAMALRTPVVTTDVGGVPEVLGNTNAGFVCSKDLPEMFAEKINMILGDPSLAALLGDNGRKAFEEKFTASRMAEQYYRIVTQAD